MVSRKQEIKNKIDGQVNELEGLLGAMLAPVTPRGEFVSQLQKRLESKFDPQPLLIIPAKFYNVLILGIAGVIGGFALVMLGIKWFKRYKIKAGWRMKEMLSSDEQGAEPQLP